MKKIRSLFQNRNYLRLFLASFTSQMGGTIGLTALMFYLLDRFSQQPAYATITELMLSMPTLMVFFLVGVFADRLDRQKIAQNCDWICAVLSILLLLSLFINLIPLTFIVLFLRSAVKSFFTPAQSALVQGILTKEYYTTAVGLNQLVASLFMLFGSGIGIFTYWAIGVEGAILVDAASFIISGLLIKSCKMSEKIRMPNGKHTIKDLKFTIVWKDFKVGLSYILKHSLLLTLISGFAVFGILNGGLSVMQIFILKYKLAPGNYEEISIILGIVFGLGVLFGSMVASILSQKLMLHHLLILAMFISGGATIVGSLVNTVWLYMVCSIVIALSLPMINVAIGGWIQKIVDPKMMGRVQGWINPLMMLSQSLTLLFIAGFYPGIFAVETLFWFVGGSLIFVGVFYILVLPRFIELEKNEGIMVD
ncbi:MFS transporter [Bacillus aquiflavi]|uniref:MFS transporter n=1 Tax=Bacillus aquiflavi TaxID=2672567 RepID=A0A6B3W474_9BACI|nr:MFS transporter [Bacillus aquiflavi]MBA4537141.1 MFS transporter [Bacillus aquiflavi]NEY82726.1 MFS transporter [Bacillus aquiflavi]UAC49767.1 MFS transporter [Bacillus aquiflavi]